MSAQLDIFSEPSRPRRSRSDEGRKLRDAGIQTAADHADAVEDRWTDRAFAELCRIGPRLTQFTSGDVRKIAHAEGLPLPPDPRSWGAVMVRARRAKLVRFLAYVPDPDPKSHRCPTSLYAWGGV